jgi:hypothetical protein
LVEEREPEDVKHEDEMLMCAPTFDKAIQDHIPPAQEEKNKVDRFPFQVFDDALFYDSKGEKVKESFDELYPSCCDEGNDMIKEVSHEDEVLICAPPFDEVFQAFVTPAQEEVNALFCDLESEEVLEESVDVLSPTCYDQCFKNR